MVTFKDYLLEYNEEEMEAKEPAVNDMLKAAIDRPKETNKSQPSQKRWDQRQDRRKRRFGYKENK